MATSNVSITDEQQADVREALELGMYNSVSEVHREALRMWQLDFERRKAKIHAIRASVEASMAALAAGEVLSNADADARIEAKIAELYPPDK